MKYAICNELFGGTDKTSFKTSLDIIRKTGFQGIEIAPYTIFSDFSGNIQNSLVNTKKIMNGEGIDFAGFHWLLVGPKDLHLCSLDKSVRQKSWDHIKLLADMAGELGGGPLTLGSPTQRSFVNSSTEDALKNFKDGLSSVADHVENTGCRLLLEALPAKFTNVVNTLKEARSIIDKIGKSGIGGMFDFHNTDDESSPWRELILEHQNYITHVHLNDEGGSAPSRVTEEYIEAFRSLKKIGYNGWISLEIFTQPENPTAILSHVNWFINKIKETQETK